MMETSKTALNKVYSLNVFVIHAKFLALRKDLCEDLKARLEGSDRLQVNFRYIEEFDPDSIPASFVDTKVDINQSRNQKYAFDTFLKGLHVRHLSNALKHHEALKLAAQSNDDTYTLILEDDVVFGDNVVNRIVSILDVLDSNPDWDVNFLGLPQPIPKDQDVGPKVSNVSTLFKVLPEISSYVVKNKSAQKFCDLYFPIRYATHVHFSFIYLERAARMKKEPLRMTMTTPNVFVDGSKFGVYLSTLSSNNQLILNQDYSKLHNIIHAQNGYPVKEYTAEQKDAMSKMLNTVKFCGHPEFMVLRGIFETQIGEYEKANETFKKCHLIYKNNSCLINGESAFLSHYAQLHKYLQTED